MPFVGDWPFIDDWPCVCYDKINKCQLSTYDIIRVLHKEFVLKEPRLIDYVLIFGNKVSHTERAEFMRRMKTLLKSSALYSNSVRLLYVDQLPNRNIRTAYITHPTLVNYLPTQITNMCMNKIRSDVQINCALNLLQLKNATCSIDISNVKNVNLSNCGNVERLNLRRNVKTLVIMGRKSILPSNIIGECLTRLYLYRTNIQTIPYIPSLQQLYLSENLKITVVPKFDYLSELYVNDCDTLANIKPMQSLYKICISRCSKLRNISDFDNLDCLNICDCPELDNITRLPSLRVMYFRCKRGSVPLYGIFPRLSKIFIRTYDKTVHVDGSLWPNAIILNLVIPFGDYIELYNMSHIRTLMIKHGKCGEYRACDHISIRDCLSIEHLTLHCCTLFTISRLNNLQTLVLKETGSQLIPLLSRLPILRKLYIKDLYLSLYSLSIFKSIPNLELIHIKDSDMRNIRFEYSPGIVYNKVIIDSCTIKSLPFIPARNIIIRNCENLRRAPRLYHSTKLTINNCPKLELRCLQLNKSS
jgi:hypothetical protein